MLEFNVIFLSFGKAPLSELSCTRRGPVLNVSFIIQRLLIQKK